MSLKSYLLSTKYERVKISLSYTYMSDLTPLSSRKCGCVSKLNPCIFVAEQQGVHEDADSLDQADSRHQERCLLRDQPTGQTPNPADSVHDKLFMPD